MPKKTKFKPEIRRVELNPEQAVLSCNCYTGSAQAGSFTFANMTYCKTGKSWGLTCAAYQSPTAGS